MKHAIIVINFILFLFTFTSCSTSTSKSDPTATLSDDLDPSEFKYGGEPRSIVSSEYERFLLVKTTSIDYCKSSITEYCELNVREEDKNTSKDYDAHRLEFSQRGMWVLVKFPEDFPFYDYHNLVGWIWGYEESPDLPSDALGFSIHKEASDKSYYVELDQTDNYGDVVVGSDKLGNSLYAYLPGAYTDGGNLRVTSEIEYSYTNALSKLSTANISLSSDDFIWENFDVKLFY